MPCYKPLSAWSQPSERDGGKRTIVFGGSHKNNWDIAQSLDLPCGQCIGCRLERSRQWAVRLMHENSLHERSSFLTLTYSDENLPASGSLVLDDFQRFFKRLRKQSAHPLRFFHCGEYGEANGRPHYHCILFGEDFASDRELYRLNDRGERLYNSPRLTEIWGLGHAVIGDVTFESAAYVARYCLKKVTGEKAAAHYGERRPEYVTMSRRPGIGSGWFEKWSSEVYPSDSVVMRGKEMLPPKYYDKLLEKVDPLLYRSVKRERDVVDSEDSCTSRLIVKEIVKNQAISTLKRSV